jgi:hypothetical protein
MIFVVVIFSLQYSIVKYHETFPPLSPQTMTYQQEMQIDFRKTINVLARSLKPGAAQEFEFKGDTLPRYLYCRAPVSLLL